MWLQGWAPCQGACLCLYVLRGNKLCVAVTHTRSVLQAAAGQHIAGWTMVHQFHALRSHFTKLTPIFRRAVQNVTQSQQRHDFQPAFDFGPVTAPQRHGLQLQQQHRRWCYSHSANVHYKAVLPKDVRQCRDPPQPGKGRYATEPYQQQHPGVL